MFSFLLFLSAVFCGTRSQLEDCLFEQCDVPKALSINPSNTSDCVLKYFLVRTFTSGNFESIANVLASDYNNIWIKLLISRTFSDSDSDVKLDIRTKLRFALEAAEPISINYFLNPYNFKEFELLETKQSKGIQDVIRTVWSLDSSVVDKFFHFIALNKIEVGKVIKELEFLCQNKVPQAYSMLGDAYFYGLGVEKDIEKALEYYWAGREHGNSRCYSGVGKVLMDDAYGDLEGAEGAFDIALFSGNDPEIFYYKHLISQIKNTRNTQQHKSTLLHRAAVKGYLPAVYEYIVDQLTPKNKADNKITTTDSAMHALTSITQFSEILMEMADKAIQAYNCKEYKRAVLYFLCLSFFKINSALQNAVYILERHKVFEFTAQNKASEIPAKTDILSQEELLAKLYNQLATTNSAYYKNLGDCYYYGTGVEQSFSKAFAYYLSAVDFSNEAIYDVAYMYENGIGVTRDLGLAYRYLSSSVLAKKCYLVVFYGKMRILCKMAMRCYDTIVFTILVGLLTLFGFYYTFKMSQQANSNRTN